eukprot:CAMPEP_0114456272 /NCGR_PEP_ID=MMETSP0104-20121206/3544_1 /TAXON_ID=37642 ORGANISM="Paraphysomonas imperforata, Strain PA2" /NCGR_SAMPLE_ID=MMETSP0104 /ASSEMBLY_ACC=CAM_ASM_000202 /LENGTH=300 /DNA_ID=CAMNT_0001628747 /DNA_START=168 /DNA_END=1071 /DNA_ORIENTATION=-
MTTAESLVAKSQEVFDAAAKGDNIVLTSYWRGGGNLNIHDSRGRTLMYLAAEKGHITLIKSLHERGAGINLPNSEGWTPLCIATLKGILVVVECLCDLGADVLHCTRDGANVINIACQAGHTKLVYFLYHQGALLNQRYTWDNSTGHASYCGHTDIVGQLIEWGVDVNYPGLNGATPVSVAAEEGHVDIVHKLLSAGANCNVPDDDGVTPLIIACHLGHLEVIHLLHRFGANFNYKSESGSSAMGAVEDTLTLSSYCMKFGMTLDSTQYRAAVYSIYIIVLVAEYIYIILLLYVCLIRII